jgi:hypothetical protein
MQLMASATSALQLNTTHMQLLVVLTALPSLLAARTTMECLVSAVANLVTQLILLTTSAIRIVLLISTTTFLPPFVLCAQIKQLVAVLLMEF